MVRYSCLTVKPQQNYAQTAFATVSSGTFGRFIELSRLIWDRTKVERPAYQFYFYLLIGPIEKNKTDIRTIDKVELWC